jgi:hypothetical protein
MEQFDIKDLIEMVEDDSRDWLGSVTYAYCAGYYSSMLQTMAHEVPGVEEYIAKRVKACKFLNKKIA